MRLMNDIKSSVSRVRGIYRDKMKTVANPRWYLSVSSTIIARIENQFKQSREGTLHQGQLEQMKAIAPKKEQGERISTTRM